jgi:RNA polymerase sigma-70 factor
MMHQNQKKPPAMPKESPLAPPDPLLAQCARLAAALHSEEICARWELPVEMFAEALRRSARKRFGCTDPAAGEMETYLKSLHLEDLALACACGEGIEKAWEFFIANYRQDLRRAAGAMLRGSGHADEARAAELADSLYAELYGVRSGDPGKRKSLFEYFHGRSKLSTWLRAVLAQKQVDLFRTSSKTVSLEAEREEESPRELIGHLERAHPDIDPDRDKYLGRFECALRTALASLVPRERMILACYYVDQLTLGEIGRMLREHESTVSRQIERIRRVLRERVTEFLRKEFPASDGRKAEPPLDPAQVKLALEYAVEDWPFDLSQALSSAEASAEAMED